MLPVRLVAMGVVLVQDTTAAPSHDMSMVPTIGKTTNAFANPIASTPSSIGDPFSTAAERSFDAPWCANNPPCISRAQFQISWHAGRQGRWGMSDI